MKLKNIESAETNHSASIFGVAVEEKTVKCGSDYGLTDSEKEQKKRDIEMLFGP